MRNIYWLLVIPLILCACGFPTKPSGVSASASSEIVTKPVIPTPTVLCVTADTALTVRFGPGTEYQPYYWLSNGDKVSITGTSSGNWISVISQYRIGWANLKYLEKCK